MYLVDTNVISERRKGRGADRGVVQFIDNPDHELYLPVQVIGELQRGITNLRRRGDRPQASLLETWFRSILEDASLNIVEFDLECARMLGVLMGVNEQHPIDKQIAAIALVNDFTVVTRNTAHFSGTGVRVLNPFFADARSNPIN